MTDFTIYYGDTKVIDLTITSDGDPINLTGKTIQFTVRNDYGEDVLIQKDTTDGGIVVTSAVDGEARLTLTPTDTVLLDNRTYTVVYDFELIDGSNKYTILDGRLLVNPVVSE